ncbi:uncharacterized protein J4E88_003501 [Alternaria novae-zelandiae]|uniref:uncharacterized protein n=1 Tax=Alternaria novae-zelandiae TaxID=430562 RepID=UPI0020C3154B|nr:uncharacterized protein J4E88_003501 [Alternaria novae-zelandiae]KAI4687908.1 hypothetical protein J4E88_003501 [Alternaria novae-zelandiae]
MAMTKYENIIWEEKMKEKIMCTRPILTRPYILKLTQSAHARILYSQQLPPDSILDVVNTTSKLPGYAFVAYTSHTVVIDGSRGWRILLSSSECMSLGGSLEETLQTLQELLQHRLLPHAQPVDKETDNLAGRSIKQEHVDGSTDRTEEQRLESENSSGWGSSPQAPEESSKKRMRY